MKIRKGRTEDIESLKKIDNFSLRAKHPADYFLENFDNIIVAIDRGRVVGYIMSKGEEISNLAVHPDFRKKGIGKSLIKEVMKKSKRLVLRTREANRDAYIFLKKIGFSRKRKIERYYSNGDDAIEMEWKKQ